MWARPPLQARRWTHRLPAPPGSTLDAQVARPRPLTAKDGATTSGVMKDWMAYGRAVPSIALAVNVALVADCVKDSPWGGPELIPAVATSTSIGPGLTMVGVGDIPDPTVHLIAEHMKTRSIAALPDLDPSGAPLFSLIGLREDEEA